MFIIFFEKTLYTDPLDKSFFSFCLFRQPSLFKFLPVRLFFAILALFGLCTGEKLANCRWGFLRAVKNIDKSASKFWSKRYKRLSRLYRDSPAAWISRYPEPVLRPLAALFNVQLFANPFDIHEGRFSFFYSYDELYKTAARSVKPTAILDSVNRSVNTTAIDVLYVYRNRAFPSSSACRRFRLLYALFIALSLLCMAIGLGLISLYFGASTYLMQMFLSYFKIPLLPLLNILPVIILICFIYFISNRVWLTFLISSITVLTASLVNYFKILLRNDPLLAADISLFFEAQTIVQRYTIDFNWKIISAILISLAAIIMAALFAKGRILSPRIRLAGLLVTVCSTLFLYMTVYTNPAIYAATENLELISRWSGTQQYISRGFIYPFIYSIQSAKVEPPQGYNEHEAVQILDAYSYDNIPTGKKAHVIAIMLEAFNDFSKFDRLELTDDIYAPFHELQAKSYSGELVTDIFAAGTVETEWSFLTGFVRQGQTAYRKNTASYVRYFKEQGYKTEGSHPCYSWFYNRINVNEYFGFDNYFFFENRYEALSGDISPDDVLFPDIISLFEAHLAADDRPYFNFSVTYQNHGPYSDSVAYYDSEYVNSESLSPESAFIINNYFHGIANTIQNINAMVAYLEDSDEPVILVLFGDHNPWLGNGNSVYKELKINLDLDEDKGFFNYYSVPYLIFANPAAKKMLEADFTGSGELISPSFLMNKVFQLAGWEGNQFMKLSSDLMRTLPVVHNSGVSLYNDILTADLPSPVANFLDKFKIVQYYRRYDYKISVGY